MNLCIKEEPHGTTHWEVCESWIPKNSPSSPQTRLPELTMSTVMDNTGSSRHGFVYDADRPRDNPEFTSDEKDTTYLVKRLKNNDSARRSRLKKKIFEKNMEDQLKDLQKENLELKYELAALKRYFSGGMNSKLASEYVLPVSRCDQSMATGSVGDTDSSESSSVHSEDETTGHHVTRDSTEDVSASPLSVLTACAVATGHQLRQLSSPFMLQQAQTLTPFPFKYSFINPASEGLDDLRSQDKEVPLNVSHSFRLKRDLHSAFATGQSGECV